MTIADVLSDPEPLATAWDLSPLVDGDEGSGVQRQLEEAQTRADAFAAAYDGKLSELDPAGLAKAMHDWRRSTSWSARPARSHRCGLRPTPRPPDARRAAAARTGARDRARDQVAVPRAAMGGAARRTGGGSPGRPGARLLRPLPAQRAPLPAAPVVRAGGADLRREVAGLVRFLGAPVRRARLPLWYGVHAPDSAERAAKRNLNVVSLDSPADTRLSIERYRATWRPPHPGATMPKLGLGRFIVVAATDAEALRLARRAYLPWHRSFTHLPRLRGRAQTHPRPPQWDALVQVGQGIAGSPETVTAFLQSQLDETQCNYVVGQFAFGDLTRDECLRSIKLFADEVMPALRAASGTAIPLPLVGRG